MRFQRENSRETHETPTANLTHDTRTRTAGARGAGRQREKSARPHTVSLSNSSSAGSPCSDVVPSDEVVGARAPRSGSALARSSLGGASSSPSPFVGFPPLPLLPACFMVSISKQTNKQTISTATKSSSSGSIDCAVQRANHGQRKKAKGPSHWFMSFQTLGRVPENFRTMLTKHFLPFGQQIINPIVYDCGRTLDARPSE